MNRHLLFIIFLITPFLLISQTKMEIIPSSLNEDRAEHFIDLDNLKALPTQSESQGINYSNKLVNSFSTKNDLKSKAYKSQELNAHWIYGNKAINKGADIESQAQGWFEESMIKMSIDPEQTEFRLNTSWNDDLNQSHYKFDQYHNQVKVFGGEIILHANSSHFIMQNGNYLPSASFPKVDINLVLSSDEIETVVKTQLKHYQEAWTVASPIGKDIIQWTTELTYYSFENSIRLAYHVNVHPNPVQHKEFLVDAISGEILNSWSNVCGFSHDHDEHGCNHNHNTTTKKSTNDLTKNKSVEAKKKGPETAVARDLLGVNRTINTYSLSNSFFMLDASRTMYNESQSNLPNNPVGGILSLDLGGQTPIGSGFTYEHILSSNNSWNNSEIAVSAHYNAGEAYEYYKETHNRESLNGNGGTITSFINVSDEDGSSLDGAFYASGSLWYGNGRDIFFPLGAALDVAGHELSHGVVETTANLIYQDEPGALNESFADIFGAMIDREDWKLGEDIVRPGVFPGGCLRNMEDPHNNASNGDFNRGWQPKHVNERYVGSLDNGGVHWNSGITNHAYYQFATRVGRSVAERVYYRALTTYLTRNSGFNDLRFAVLQSAEDLYNNSVVQDAATAFDLVGITDGSPSNNQQDVTVNPGTDLLITSDDNFERVILFNLQTSQAVFSPLEVVDHISKPSVSDDGGRIVFIGTDNRIHVSEIDWNTNPPQLLDQYVTGDPIWRNVVVSKDGNRLAIIEDDVDNRVLIIDLVSQTQQWFDLYNPSYTDGVETGDVLYIDAMEFDHTGNYLMYDAFNEISTASGTGQRSFWDIGFLKFWDENSNNFVNTGEIEKLFGSLPEDISVGNPTFSKNSPYVICFDVRQGTDHFILGMNIETSDQGLLFDPNETSNNVSYWGFPNYSRLDDAVVFNANSSSGDRLGIVETQSDKITAVNGTENTLGEDLQWGVWFSNGERVLSDVEEIVDADVSLLLSPNPAENILNLKLQDIELEERVALEVMDFTGKIMIRERVSNYDLKDYNLNLELLTPGAYFINLRTKSKLITKKFIKK